MKFIFIHFIIVLFFIRDDVFGAVPTGQPSGQPTGLPTISTSQPSAEPSGQPTSLPSGQPTSLPSGQPTGTPSAVPSGQPSTFPTSEPSRVPSGEPTGQPSSVPSIPTSNPTSSAPTRVFDTHVVVGTLDFEASDTRPCQPLTLNLSMTFNQQPSTDVLYGRQFMLLLPGITNGDCIVGGNSGVDVPNMTIYDASGLFSVHYYEGDWRNYFADTYLMLETSEAIDPDIVYTILIDRDNGLKRSCLNTSSFEMHEYRPSLGYYEVIGTLDLVGMPEDVFSQCFPIYSQLEFYPRQQKVPNEITATFGFASRLELGDIIRVFLPGFTRAGKYIANIEELSTLSTIADYSLLSHVSWNTVFDWNYTWHEGSFSDGYANSYVEFTPLLWVYGPSKSIDDFPRRNEIFSLTISRTSQVSPYCGQKTDFEGFAFELIGDWFSINKTSFASSSGIGFGCDGQNRCNGNGQCNYCTSTCDCYDGFGSERDRAFAVTDDFAPDCSSSICPVGPAVRNLGRDSLFPLRQHRLMECSNNGKCNRNNGTCTCFKGFGGAACEKMDCPGTPACNGRGQCLPTTVLAVREDALPLSTETVQYRHYEGGDGRSWDANFGHSCVCDSSWSVGLQDGQTQQAEYFGPSCEYRHCPTGDSPQTVGVDETDCFNKTVTGTGELGLVGNKCHVDCSDLGVCDYNSGVCSCFDGYEGSNCGMEVEISEI